MNILVFDAKAVGSAIGGTLALHGNYVTLVGRDPHMSAIRSSGLVISGLWGRHRDAA
jgi:2-dehydropantoate 2-reductase